MRILWRGAPLAAAAPRCTHAHASRAGSAELVSCTCSCTHAHAAIQMHMQVLQAICTLAHAVTQTNSVLYILSPPLSRRTQGVVACRQASAVKSCLYSRAIMQAVQSAGRKAKVLGSNMYKERKGKGFSHVAYTKPGAPLRSEPDCATAMLLGEKQSELFRRCSEQLSEANLASYTSRAGRRTAGKHCAVQVLFFPNKLTSK